jgi:hypothetical protein
MLTTEQLVVQLHETQTKDFNMVLEHTKEYCNDADMLVR